MQRLNHFLFHYMTEGYLIKDYHGPVKRYVQTMDLKDEPALIARYRRAHSKEEAWQEILDGIRQVGILEMEVYIIGCRLVMIVEAPIDFEWENAMTRLAKLPRQEEWETFVAQFQRCDPSATSDEKWQMMERIFHLY